MVKVFVSNQSHHMCSFLERTVNYIDKFQVVGSFTSGLFLFEFLPTLEPDICLLDVGLSDLDGFALVKKIRRNYRHLKLLVITDRIHPYTVHYMIKYGVRGIIPTSSTTDEITDAVIGVGNGYHYSDVAPQSLFTSIKRREIQFRAITNRQQEYIQYCYEGLRHKQIAEEMGISWMSLKDHQEAVFTNLKVKTRSELIRVGVETGLIKT